MKNKFWVSSSIALLIMGAIGTPFASAEISHEVPTKLTENKEESEKEVVANTNQVSSEKISVENTIESSVTHTKTIKQEMQEKNSTTSQVSPAAVPAVQSEVTSNVTGTWGTATYEFDETTGTITVHDGEISGGWSHDAANHPSNTPILSVKHVVFGNDVILGEDCGWLFSNYSNLLSVSGRPDASRVVNMNAMFYKASNLISADLSDWDTLNLLQTSYMFSEASKLVNINLSNFNTSKVTNMAYMFHEASSLTSLDLSNFDTSNTNNMSYMFDGTSSLTSLDLSNFDTSNTNNMKAMFSRTSSLTSLDLSNFDTSNTNDMTFMFYNASSLTSLDLSNFDTSNVKSMPYMFYNASSLTSLDLSNFDTSNTNDMSYMFHNTTDLSNLNLGNSSIFNSTVSLPLIGTSSGEYSGRWIDESTGVTYVSSDNFMINYNGTKPGTYVWEKSSLSIEAKNLTLYVGDTWNPKDSFISAKDALGNLLDLEDVAVEGTVDTTKVGTYLINYKNNTVSKQIIITVISNQETLVTKDMTIFEDGPWTAADHIISATTKDGTMVNFDDLTLEGISSVDPSKAGTYTFKATNGKTTNVVKLTVLKDQSSITVFDSTITVGDSWSAADNFDSATDRYGNPLNLSDLTVTGTVDTNKAGKYKVTYSWAIKNADGSLTGETLSIDAYITVVDKATTPHSDSSTSTKVTPTATKTLRTTSSSGTQGSYRSLPKTGEESSFSELALGASLLLLGGALALFGVKKRKKN